LSACYWQTIVCGKRKGFFAFCLGIILYPLSLIYRVIVCCRNMAYDTGLLHTSSLRCTVISVGNIVAGGVGKTPLVYLLARAFTNRGRRVAILSRGYRASKRGGDFPRVVTDGTHLMCSADEAGDEPVMLAKALEGVVVVIDPNRTRAGRMAIERFGVDLLILDDAFQHRALSRNLDILLVDCIRPFANGHLLPAGQLREPPKSVRRAQLLVLTRCTADPPPSTLEKLRSFNRSAHAYAAWHEPTRLRRIPDGSTEHPNMLRGRKIAAFSGIARPDDFKETLSGLGAKLLTYRIFPDHHRFSTKEIGEIIDGARRSGAEAIITTAKDSVRLPDGTKCPLPFFYLEIEMRVGTGENKLIESVLQALGNSQANGM
jgi:tetraacyldisaccharide 4'-kinase